MRMFLSGLPLLLLFPSKFSAAQELPSLDAIAGKALFDKTWVSAPASTAASDGLGPFFNARSCGACHPAAGRGSLPEALVLVAADPVYGEFIQTRAVQGLHAEAQVRQTFRTQIVQLADGTEVNLQAPDYELADPQYGMPEKPVFARLAPSLIGLHQLEQVPEHYLEALADPDDSNNDGISGRLGKVTEPVTGLEVTGRFGWKAEGYSLSMQIAKALSLDMGLGNSLFPSAFGDCTPHQSACLQMPSGNSPAATDPEVSDTILDLLVIYLRSLDAAAADADNDRTGTPVSTVLQDEQNPNAQPSVTSPARTMDVEPDPTGAGLFTSIGCSACHVPSLPAGEDRIRPFTDLLLHDLGPGLAAAATQAAEAGEWRTAPLWGLGSAPFYLHDGRARTLAEAILWHSGEAAESTKSYSRLPAAEREVLHSWLHRL